MPEDEVRVLYAELKQLGVKIDNLAELFNHAAHGDGFPRCAARANRLRHLEEGLELCHNRVGGVKKWLVAALVSVVSLLANIVWNMARSSLRQ